MADDPQPGQNDLSDKVFKVEVVSAPRSAWSIAVDRIKELSVVFTAGFAALNFMMPQSVKDDVAIWWAALDAPRADLVEPVVLEAPVIEGGDDSGPTGWVYAGNGSASDTSTSTTETLESSNSREYGVLTGSRTLLANCSSIPTCSAAK